MRKLQEGRPEGREESGGRLGAPAGQPIKRYTRLEVAQHERAIEQLLLAARSMSQILAVMRQQFGLKPWRVKALVKRVEDRWVAEGEAQRSSNKEVQVRRLMSTLQDAKGQKDASGNWVTRPNFSAIARIEELLSKILGTQAPIEVRVEAVVSESLTAVIASLTGDQMTTLLEEHREMTRQAEAYRLLTAPAAE